MCVYRWGHTPLDDAIRFQRYPIKQYLEAYAESHPDQVLESTADTAIKPDIVDTHSDEENNEHDSDDDNNKN